METSAFPPRLRILHLEDNPMDCRLVAQLLEADGLHSQLETVMSRAEFEGALARQRYDLILADFQLPDFNGLEALEQALQVCPETPFIFVSGMMGEDKAIDSLNLGATDYVLKNRLERLVPGVRRALNEALERKQHQDAELKLRRSEEQFRVFMDNLPAIAFIKDASGQWLWCNRCMNDLLGPNDAPFTGRLDADLFPPGELARVRELEAQVLQSGKSVQTTEQMKFADGGGRHWLVSRFPMRNEAGELLLGGVAFDITARIKAENALIEERAKLEEMLASATKTLEELVPRLV